MIFKKDLILMTIIYLHGSFLEGMIKITFTQ